MAVGAPSDRIVYCEIPFEQASETCSLADAIAMTISTYRARLGSGLDRLFPQYAADVAAAKGQLDAASAALAPLEAAEQDVSHRVDARQVEINAAVAPLIDQVNQANASLNTVTARYSAVVDEISRVQTRLQDPSLSQNDHDVLSAKLAELTTESHTELAQIDALETQLRSLNAQIAATYDDAQLNQLRSDLATAQDRVQGAQAQVTQATANLGAAAGRRDGKIGDILTLAAGPSLHVTDFGDDASRLLFDPFRAPGAPFATGSACKLTVTGYLGTSRFEDSIYADPGTIFPAEGALTALPTTPQSIEFFENASFEGAPPSEDSSIGLRGAWPALAAVAVPTGTFVCQAAQVLAP